MGESRPGAGDGKDAVFLSPHKIVGGPQTPGVLVLRRDLVRNRVPTIPGGDTVAFVDPTSHRYLDDPVAREEGGTPAIVESIRAGLAFALKQAVGTEVIQAREERSWSRALHRWSDNPAIEVLGSSKARRLSIVSVRLRHGARYLHHNFVVALLNDLFGIQARGGCFCAGPYGHRLLAIDADRSHAFRDEIGLGCEGIKPGWTRINFNYFVSDAVADYLIDAVDLVARYGYRLLTDYRFDPRTGLWRHYRGPVRAPRRLTELAHLFDGESTRPGRADGIGEDALTGYLREARDTFDSRDDRLDEGVTGLPDDSKRFAGSTCLRRALGRSRWSALPTSCADMPRDSRIRTAPVSATEPAQRASATRARAATRSHRSCNASRAGPSGNPSSASRAWRAYRSTSSLACAIAGERRSSRAAEARRRGSVSGPVASSFRSRTAVGP